MSRSQMIVNNRRRLALYAGRFAYQGTFNHVDLAGDTGRDASLLPLAPHMRQPYI